MDILRSNHYLSEPNDPKMSSPRILIPLATLVMLSSMAASVHAQTTLVLAPSRSVSVGYHDNFSSANTNYNGTVQISAFSQPGSSGGVNTGRGLLDFDLSMIPNDATILGAFLSLSASGPQGIGAVISQGSMGSNSCKLLRITSSWNENTVTWNNQPATTALNAVPLAQSTYTMENYLNIDVTTLVQDMVSDPANSHGFMLRLDNESPTRGLCIFSGFAPQLDKRPALVIVYGDCGSNGIGESHEGHDHLTLSPSITNAGSTIHLDMGNIYSGPSTLVLVNSLGQVVFTRPENHWPVTLTVPALAQGTYTWKVQDAVGTALGIARMVVQ